MPSNRVRGPARARAPVPALFVALLIGAMALAGCMGDDAPTTTDDGTDQVDTQAADPTPEDELNEQIEKAKEEQENVPEAHYHHYWGNPPLPEVTIFQGTVTLTTDHCTDSEAQSEGDACIGPEPRIGSVRFDLEDDGDQIPADERRAEVDGHADTVFTGTSAIKADLSWDAAQLGNQLLLYYKPANSPVFFPLQGDGIPVSTEDPSVTIPVGVGMADPAHQFRVSRWAFKLVADSGPHEQWPGYAYLGTGDVNVDMRAINGGKKAIDPPHPDPWEGRDVIEYGGVDGNFAITQVHAENGDVTQTAYVRGDGFEGIKMPSRAIVPTGTQKLVVTATVTAADEASAQMDWGLKWHGANDKTYLIAEEPEDGEGGARIYTIPIDGYLVDPPYVSESFFEFGFYPITGGQPMTGNYEAEYTLQFTIHKDPQFTYFF